MDKELIIEKVKKNIDLTVEEEMYYLTNIAGFSTDESETIIAIADNKSEAIID